MVYRDRREWNKRYYQLKLVEKREECNRKRRRLQDIKASTPCKDCKKRFPHYVMDFDHFREKKYTVSHMTNRSWGVIETELKKCHVVCANCHKIRTHRRRKRARRIHG